METKSIKITENVLKCLNSLHSEEDLSRFPRLTRRSLNGSQNRILRPA